jgi:hypothetical protein
MKGKRKNIPAITLTTIVRSAGYIDTASKQAEGRTEVRRKKHLQEKYFDKKTNFTLFDSRILCDGEPIRKLIFLISDYDNLSLEERGEIQELYPSLTCIGFNHKLKRGWNLILHGSYKNSDTAIAFPLQDVFDSIEFEKKLLQNLFSTK